MKKTVNKEDSIIKDAQELAHANKVLYDAHIKEGFLPVQKHLPW